VASRWSSTKKWLEEVIELGSYQAETWKHPQRVILVIIDRPDSKTGQLPLFVKHFFLVTNGAEEQKSGENVLEHYRRRGTFEDRLGEFKAAVGPHLSSPQFHENEALLLLSLLAYNLAGMLRTELEAEEGACWDLKRFTTYCAQSGGPADQACPPSGAHAGPRRHTLLANPGRLSGAMATP